MQRRTFLKMLGGAAGGLLLPGNLHLALGANPKFADECFIFIHANGGWDVTVGPDPRNRYGAGARSVEPATSGLVDTAGLGANWTDETIPGTDEKTFKMLVKNGRQFGPGMGRLLNFADRMTVVNGISMNTVSHFDGMFLSSTGKHPDGGRPAGTSIDSLITHELGTDNILPAVSIGEYPGSFVDRRVREKARPVRVSKVDQVSQSLARSTARVDGKIRDYATEFLKQEARAAAENAYHTETLLAYEQQLTTTDLLLGGDVQKLFSATELQRLQPEFYEADNRVAHQSGMPQNCAFTVEALRRRLVRTVSFGTASFDSHGEAAYREHPQSMMEMLDLVADLVEALSRTSFQDSPSKKLADHTHIVITSDFCRTPWINENRGRDHYPNNSCIIVSPKFKGGSTFGRTGEDDLLPLPVASSGFAAPRAPTPGDILTTLMDAFEIDAQPYLRDGAVIPELLKP
jgi:uncharacterized protein (DUF1501 family)